MYEVIYIAFIGSIAIWTIIGAMAAGQIIPLSFKILFNGRGQRHILLQYPSHPMVTVNGLPSSPNTLQPNASDLHTELEDMTDFNTAFNL